MKTYCKNCKYGRKYDYVDEYYCNKIVESYIDNMTGEYWERKYENSILNKNNKCKYYKRKWWKFWL